MSFVTEPLTSHNTGAEIRGIDLSGNVSEQDKADLNQRLAQYGMLVVRDQTLAPAQFMSAGRIFGEIMPHHRKEGETTEDSSIFEVKNIEVSPGKYYVVGESFHTDHSNDRIPPKATMLHPVSLPDRGGDTQFVNVMDAYDDLPDTMKAKIADLLAVHVYESKYSPRRLKKLDEETLAHLPLPAVHPLVRIHPDNGRNYLYLNPVRMDAIIGMPDDAARELIAELMAHATQQKYEYRHRWSYGDFVVWDNRSVMHQANADYEMTQLRKLIRLMIKGKLDESDISRTKDYQDKVMQRGPTGYSYS